MKLPQHPVPKRYHSSTEIYLLLLNHCIIPLQASIPTNGETLRINALLSEFIKYEYHRLFFATRGRKQYENELIFHREKHR